jgi:hypothetical protein
MLGTIKKRALRYAREAGVPGLVTPDAIFQDGSEKERRAFFNAAIAKNRAGYDARVRLMKQLAADAAAHPDVAQGGLKLPEIPFDKGVMSVRPDNLPVLDEAIAEARAAFAGYTPGTAASKRAKDSLEGVARPDRSYESAINRLAMHPEVLRVISNYMGMVPLLYRINILYSPNNEVIEASSQFYHLDPEDVIMAKIFVFVEDVDDDTGPTTALPADRSALVRQAITYRKGRVPDDVVERHGGAEHLVACTGKAGTMAFLDTCRCFHMGSRKAGKPRYAIMIQYQSPYAASFPLEGPIGNMPVGEKAVPPHPTELEEYLLGLKR